MLRGWIGPSHFISGRKQREILIKAGVDERAIYSGAEDWGPFVRSLRAAAKDQAAVADLRVFGSRKALVAAVEEIEAKGATLVSIETGTQIDLPTLRAMDRTLTKWRGEATFKNPKRASKLGKFGVEVRKRNIANSRLDKDAARAIWLDMRKYPSIAEAIGSMPGWTRTTAWRFFGPRIEETPRRVKRSK